MCVCVRMYGCRVIRTLCTYVCAWVGMCVCACGYGKDVHVCGVELCTKFWLTRYKKVNSSLCFVFFPYISYSLVDPPKITQQPASPVFAGSQVRFTVADITGAGALTYKWQRDGVDLSEGGGVSNPTLNTLTISSVRKTNEGTYTCVVSNTAGATNTSNAVQMTVRKCLFLLFFLSS